MNNTSLTGRLFSLAGVVFVTEGALQQSYNIGGVKLRVTFHINLVHWSRAGGTLRGGNLRESARKRPHAAHQHFCATTPIFLINNIYNYTFFKPKNFKPFLHKWYINHIFIIWLLGEREFYTCCGFEFNASYNCLRHFPVCPQHSFWGCHKHGFCVQAWDNLYQKPTGTRQFLQVHSSHSRHCKTALPYNQAHGFKQVDNNDGNFDSVCTFLKNSHLSLKYPHQVIHHGMSTTNELKCKEIFREKFSESAKKFFEKAERTFYNRRYVQRPDWSRIDRHLLYAYDNLCTKRCGKNRWQGFCKINVVLVKIFNALYSHNYLWISKKLQIWECIS